MVRRSPSVTHSGELHDAQGPQPEARRHWASSPMLLVAAVLAAMAFGANLLGYAVIVPVLLALVLLALIAAALKVGEAAPQAAAPSPYAVLAENLSDVIIRHARCGSVSFVSPAAARVIGLRESDLLGNGLFEHVHVADRPAYLRALSEAMAGDNDQAVEFRLRQPARGEAGFGDVRFSWVEMRCRSMQTGDGREIVSTLADIAARKAQEGEVDAARAEVDRAHQARSRFLANVSHELRTPLNAILGFSEMLMNEAVLKIDAERRNEYAGLIHASGGHLLNLVNSILDMSKLESGHFQITPEPFELRPLVENSCQMLRLNAQEAGISLDVDVPEHLPELNADKRACRQILLNLISNAVKFTGRDGSIIVGARNEGHHIAIFVADTGAGIGDDDLSRLGTPFFQAKSTYDKQHQGTGLGLSVVRGLVELHGGRMDIVSRLGEGTRVTVHLPAAPAVATPIRLPGAPALAPDVDAIKFADDHKKRA